MTESTRAIAATVAALPRSAAQRSGDPLAARYRVDGDWRELTYTEVVAAIDEVALGLAELGIEPGDRVGVLADTRVEWTVASYGISAAGGVVVPVYPTNSPRECAWVLGNSGARAVICENEAQVAKVEQVRDELPDLGTVVASDGEAGDLSLEALGLAELGIEPGDRVGVLADTRVEWTLASYGISATGGVVVPVYPTNSPPVAEMP